ncbi:MAG: hypothetical protein ACI8UP_004490 [Porticoccaceae bacterium]|jgi:hypothetical protein
MNNEIPSSTEENIAARLQGENPDHTDMMSVYYLYALPLYLTTETIKNMLPEGLSPDLPNTELDSTHLSFFIFGAQKEVKLEVSPFGIDYLEASFAIPALTYDNGKKMYSYWVKLYCTSSFATALGQRMGYPKVLSTFEKTRNTICITCTTDEQKDVITATIGEELAPKSLDEFHVLKNAKMSEEAFISFIEDKPYVSERVESKYSYVTPLNLSVDFTHSGIKGLDGIHSAKPLEGNVMGAFRTVQAAEWRWPTPMEQPTPT